MHKSMTHIRQPLSDIIYNLSLLDTGAPELVIKAQILAGGRGKGTFDSGFKGKHPRVTP